MFLLLYRSEGILYADVFHYAEVREYCVLMFLLLYRSEGILYADVFHYAEVREYVC